MPLRRAISLTLPFALRASVVKYSRSNPATAAR
jgi:hypothetical protein